MILFAANLLTNSDNAKQMIRKINRERSNVLPIFVVGLMVLLKQKMVSKFGR